MNCDPERFAIETLRYLRPFMLEKSVIVLDDYFRGADGMIKAVSEFTAEALSGAHFPSIPARA